MAGPIPIDPTDAELGMLQDLSAEHMRLFLTDLDECGWSIARELLRELGQRATAFLETSVACRSDADTPAGAKPKAGDRQTGRRTT